MRFIALLALVAVIPVVGAGGYMLNPDPTPPAPLTVKQTLVANLKEDGEQAQEQWLYIVTKGVLRGSTSDAAVVAQLPPSDLKGYPGRYVVRTCWFYSTSGRQSELFDREMVGYCTQRKVTKATVLEHAKQVS